MKKQWITTVSFILLLIFVGISVDQSRKNLALKKELGRHYQSLIYDTGSLVYDTQQLNLGKIRNAENGDSIIRQYKSRYSSLSSEYLLFTNEVRRLYGLLSEIAMLQSTLLDKGSWTTAEEERHSTLLRTLQLILLDFKDLGGSDSYIYNLYTKEDSPLIDIINKRVEYFGLEF